MKNILKNFYSNMNGDSACRFEKGQDIFSLERDCSTIIQIRIATALVVSKRGGHLQLGKILKEYDSNTNSGRACRLKRGGHLKTGKILKDVYLNTWIGIWIGVLILYTLLFNNTIKCYITMVFPHGQPSRKKKYKIGYRDKKVNSYDDYQKTVAAAGDDVGETANDTDSAISVPKPPAKIPRADKNWADNYQVQRSLNYCNNKVAKLWLKSNDLSKKNQSLKVTVHKKKSTIKDLNHQMHVDAKAKRTTAVQTEDAHKAALAALSEEFASEIDEAHAVDSTKIEKNMEAESCRILADREHMKSLEKERTKQNEKMDKERAKQCDVVAH